MHVVEPRIVVSSTYLHIRAIGGLVNTYIPRKALWFNCLEDPSDDGNFSESPRIFRALPMRSLMEPVERILISVVQSFFHNWCWFSSDWEGLWYSLFFHCGRVLICHINEEQLWDKSITQQAFVISSQFYRSRYFSKFKHPGEIVKENRGKSKILQQKKV